MKIDLDALGRMTPDARAQLRTNALKHKGGAEVVQLIDSSGLPLSMGGLSFDHPVHRRIVEIAWSNEGREAAISATKAGLPALAGVDVLLQAALGAAYHKHDLGTASAGAVVAEVMRHLGYTQVGTARCPEECTARSGAVWAERPK